jgi:hypothetical protein
MAAPITPQSELSTEMLTNSISNLNITSSCVFDSCLKLIEEQKTKEESKDIWKNSKFKDLVKLQSNNAGIVGEQLIQNICNETKITAEINGEKTKQEGGGGKDGIIDGVTVEIKCAHQGSGNPSFQHELGEVPWKPQIMIFVDIAPTNIYITAFPNFKEETYKSKEKLTQLFPTKTITWRKKSGAFKLDMTLKINEENVKKGITFKISDGDNFSAAGDYLRKIISDVKKATPDSVTKATDESSAVDAAIPVSP